MKVLLVQWVVLSTLLCLGQAQDLQDRDENNDVIEITHKVNRIIEEILPSSSEEEDDDDELDDYDYPHDNVDPRNREKIAREPYRRYRKFQQGWKQHPLYVIILGGFRWDFLHGHEKSLTSFEYLKKHGTSIPFVNAVFPTEDYPVWTSIATGQHPEDHGIVGDYMYDLKRKQVFNASDLASTRNAEWWKDATPFWSTAAKHGKKIAFYNWHDCQLPGAALENPQDCRPYTPPAFKQAVPSKSKIAREFDEAFTKLYKDRYHATVVYTDLLRRVSELHGPNSEEMIQALKDVDDVLQAKLIDVRSKEEGRAGGDGLKMNVLVLSDYGLTDTDTTTDVVLEEYIDLDDAQYVMYAAGYVTIVPYALRHERIIQGLSEMPGMDVYLGKRVQDPPVHGGKLIPDEFKYGKGDFTQDILAVAKPSFRIVSMSQDPKIMHVQNLEDDILKAGSGFNPNPQEIIYPYIDKRTIITKQINDTIRDFHLYQQFKWDMRTQAFAVGPDFKKSYVLNDPIQVLDIYQLLCFLLRIPPGEHAGKWSRIEPMLTVSSATTFTILPFLILATTLASLLLG